MLSTTQSTTLNSILISHITQLYTHVDMPDIIPKKILSHTSLMPILHILQVHDNGINGAIILSEWDKDARIATTPTMNNYCTGSAGTLYCKTHSPIAMARCSKYSWRRSKHWTPGMAKRSCREAKISAYTVGSTHHIPDLQFQLKSWLSLGDPNSGYAITRYSMTAGK